MKISKSLKGFTLIEIMIVVGVIGILAAIAIPNFLNLKDKAIWGTARANLEVVRSSLAAFATDNEVNRYPVGNNMNYTNFRHVVPKANLPDEEVQVKFLAGSFRYRSEDGSTFSISVNVDNRAYDLLVASPNGITPSTYDEYVR